MLLNHHILAKRATDSILAKFKNGAWSCLGHCGKDFLRTACDADFPSPDAAFSDSENNLIISFEFKPPTETKRGILTGLGQSIAYLQFSDLSYLIIPEVVEDYNIAGHVSDIFSSVLSDKVPVGLISYKNDNPTDVSLVHNVNGLQSDAKSERKAVTNNRFWAKHVDMPIPLFHLLLHYAYRAKVERWRKDPFAKCWDERMAPKSSIKDLAPKPVKDVNGEEIRTLAGKESITYLKTTINKIRAMRLSPSQLKKKVEDLLRQTDSSSTVDNKYTAVRKNCLPFMRHVGMLDSNWQITSEGLKMYHLGMVNGPKSRLFRDYFTRMVLLDGHHIDLIYDLERLSCDHRGSKNDKEIKSLLLNDYALRGMIKTNPGRCADPSVGRKKPVLADETRLWDSLGLMRKSSRAPEFAFDWQRIMEVCNLPDL